MARTTDKRERILEYITQFTRENGYSPSVREICEGVGLASTATVHYHLNALRQEGSINMDGKKNRTISLPDRLPIGKIPVVGVVTAGVPILAVENIEGYLPWDGDESCFALRVRGDSMINAGILSGDKVVVHPQKTAENGQIVVALLDDSATVKRFHRERARSGFCRRTLRMSPSTAPIAQSGSCQSRRPRILNTDSKADVFCFILK